MPMSCYGPPSRTLAYIPKQQSPWCGAAAGLQSPALVQPDLELVHTELVYQAGQLVLRIPLFLYRQKMSMKFKGKVSCSFHDRIFPHLLQKAKHPNTESVSQFGPGAAVCAVDE